MERGNGQTADGVVARLSETGDPLRELRGSTKKLLLMPSGTGRRETGFIPQDAIRESDGGSRREVQSRRVSLIRTMHPQLMGRRVNARQANVSTKVAGWNPQDLLWCYGGAARCLGNWGRSRVTNSMDPRPSLDGTATNAGLVEAGRDQIALLITPCRSLQVTTVRAV